MQSTITNKKRVNTHISLEAHEILYKHTTPKTMGAFLSNLLLDYNDREQTIAQRVQQIEVQLDMVKKALYLLETAQQLDRIEADTNSL